MAREATILAMTCNVGRSERVVRMLLGVALGAGALWSDLPDGWRVTLGALGVVAIITGAVRFCPLWRALGINTCPRAGR